MANIAQIIGGIKPAQIQQPDPFQSMNQSLTLKALLGQGDLQNLQIDTARRSAEKNKRLEALFASNPKATAEDVMAVDLDKGLAYKKSLLDAQQAQSTIGRNNAQTEQATQATQAARIKAARDSLAGVTDQTAYDAWKQANASLPVAQSAPQMFDPQWQRRSVMDADKFITQMTPKFEKVDIGGEIKMVDTNPFTNPGIATINYKKTFSPGDRVSMRGQDMTQATAERGQDLTNTRERDVDLQGRIAQAREAGKTVGEATTNAAMSLPQAQGAAEKVSRLITGLLGTRGRTDLKPGEAEVQPHAGFRNAVGVGFPWAAKIPGTDAADFRARFDELKGGAFLQAFESLKGGGSITEREGKAAADAITRMDLSQSEAEFVTAARDFEKAVNDGFKKLQAKAGQAPKVGGVLTRNADGSYNYGAQ